MKGKCSLMGIMESGNGLMMTVEGRERDIMSDNKDICLIGQFSFFYVHLTVSSSPFPPSLPLP